MSLSKYVWFDVAIYIDSETQQLAITTICLDGMTSLLVTTTRVHLKNQAVNLFRMSTEITEREKNTYACNSTINFARNQMESDIHSCRANALK